MSKRQTYQSYVKINEDKNVTWFDYIYMIYHFEDIPDDLILSIINITSPKFIKIDGALFLDNLFIDTKYQEKLAQNKSKKSIQYWLNMVHITGVFEFMSYDDVLKIGEKLVTAWNNKIKAEYDTYEFGKAHLLCDEDEDEIVITIHRYKENEAII
ncbi:hypothetical protein [Providencia stuartii]|uniref:hypothetical protein n=1 Tax=Providencia stuartii TaxID=588 RepID=UPI001123019F|nr:hypothetical protein [Providencia stuartii]